jgi:hypothetical protein
MLSSTQRGRRKASREKIPLSLTRDALICPRPRNTDALRLRLDLRLAVRDLDAQLLRAGDDVDTLPCGDGV